MVPIRGLSKGFETQFKMGWSARALRAGPEKMDAVK
jgi:hypothetical protein